MLKFIRFIFLLFIVACAKDTVDFKLNAPKIILISIDGVRWHEMFDAYLPVDPIMPAGSSRLLIPNIYEHFVDNGIAVGKASPAYVGGPAHVSQPGYLEIMRGYPSLDCLDNYCPQNIKPTLINQFSNDAAVFAGWDTISKVFDNSLAVVNIGRKIRSQQWKDLGLLDNTDYPDEFDDEEYRADQYTVDAAVRYLKAVEQPSFMWLSLGDPDEWAHANNQLFYWASLNWADQVIGELVKHADPNTVFIICPDHGRSDPDWQNHHWEPASGKVWIMIAGPGITKAGFVSYDQSVYLSDIYPTIMEIVKGEKSDKSLLNYKR